MKIIALFPVKNEDWILPTTLPQLRLFADEILCIDGGSTDGTRKLLESHGVLIKNQDKNNLNYSSWRQELLEWGRSRGGTHFIWLDADEAFTTNFLQHYREEFEKMQPGEKLVMQWLCLWKSPFKYRKDSSIWTDLYKDFVFCDDGISSFGTTKLHEGRTPGENNDSTWVKLAPEIGAVLHFQFVPFMKFQIKQVFMLCREYVLGTASPRRLNKKYSGALDDPSAKTTPVPYEWLAGIEGLDSIEDSNTSWYTTETLDYFQKKGIETFEPLEIWHIPQYRDMFIEKTKRTPRSKTYPSWVLRLHALKNKITTLRTR